MAAPAWLGIGAQRSGTTWFTDLLTQHPQVDLGTNGKKEQHLLHKVADGVLALAGSTATLDDVRVAGCARAGILYDRSSGRLSRARASDNRFGLVVQGSPAPQLKKESENAFTGNSAADELFGADLLVPASAPPLP